MIYFRHPQALHAKRRAEFFAITGGTPLAMLGMRNYIAREAEAAMRRALPKAQSLVRFNGSFDLIATQGSEDAWKILLSVAAAARTAHDAAEEAAIARRLGPAPVGGMQEIEV